jgi:hypothetical protein
MSEYGDIRDILFALPHHDPHGGTSYYKSDLFTVRHEIIRGLDPQPTSVFEFGALYGYFLVTALDALHANDPDSGFQLVAWCDNETHTPGSNIMCEMNLRHAFPFLETAERGYFLAPLYKYVTSREQIPAGVTFDLVQVDSDHSYEGCLADLRAAEKLNPRWIMIDDWTSDHGPDISRAVSSWFEETEHHWDTEPFETANGLLLLTRQSDST